MALALVLAGAGSALAREVTVRGAPMGRFGRIELVFDQPTKVQARVANSVLVIGFAGPARIKAERLAAELAPYVSIVRRDPDETGLRVALTGPVRASVLEAGERVFVDLLPPGWTGLPPGLPPEIVAELAERARAAEEKLRRAAKPVEAPRSVQLRLAQLPTVTRLVFEPPAGTPIQIREGAAGIDAVFAADLVLDENGEKPRIAPGVTSFAAERRDGGLAVRIGAAPGYGAKAFQDGDALVVDLAKPVPPRSLPQPAAASDPAAHGPSPAASGPAPAPVPGDARAVAEAGPTAPPSRAAPVTPSVQAAALPPAPLSVRAEPFADAPSLLFPFRAPTAAAAFERGGRLVLVFDTRDTIDPTGLAATARDVLPLDGVKAEDGFVVLRFAASARTPARLVADGDSWRLVLGAASLLPPDPVKVARGVDGSGMPLVTAGLSAGAAHWLADDSGRLAVVTASGRPQGLSIPRGFVEFDLPATLHGLVVDARAEDLTVGLTGTAVAIGRPVGLTLSGAAARDGGEPAPTAGLVLSRAVFAGEPPEAARERYQALVAEAANASRSGRAEARFRLARFLVSIGLDLEAGSVMALARQDDAVFAKRRETALLSGIAAARAGRPEEARRFFDADGVGNDPEAVFWRATLDLGARRWDAGLAGMRRSAEILDVYPDEIVAKARLGALDASLARGDVARAEAELAAIDRLPTGSLPHDDHDLARARVDEAAGRSEPAGKAFERLAEDADGRIGAAARLRVVQRGLAAGTLSTPDAIRRLEVLSAAWRGDEVEFATVTELVRAYGRERRWRDMFSAARLAARYFPKGEGTRDLYDATARQFEALLLGPDGDQLSAIDTLALYFDFREFAPVGRRGDEIVRRLSDRLVELDLLDQAADLLQHQIDNRLTGVARATVAARLAAIRLLAGKPMPALAALAGTRVSGLPETVRRTRVLLEARAQADLTRTDLALEILDGEKGRDVERQRAAILWDARRWREAGETGEQIVGTAWSGAAPLSDRDRRELVRSAVAFQLADEPIGLDRLRQKFSAKMADSPDAAAFALLMRPDAVRDRGFRAVAEASAKGDSLKELLADLRRQSAEGAPAQDGPAASGAGPAPAASGAGPKAASGPAPSRS